MYPSAPRRYYVTLELPEFGKYEGHIAPIKDKESEQLYSQSEIFNMKEFDMTWLTRGILSLQSGKKEIVVLSPKSMWEKVSSSNLIGQWEEVDGFIFRWFEMDDNYQLNMLEGYTISFNSNKTGKEEIKSLKNAYATPTGGDKYNVHNKSWSRNITGGYYFYVKTNSTSTFNWSLKDDNIISLKFPSAMNVQMSVTPYGHIDNCEESYKTHIEKQVQNDIKTNGDVRLAKQSHKKWVQDNFGHKNNVAKEYEIYKIAEGLIVLHPANTQYYNPYHCIILRKK